MTSFLPKKMKHIKFWQFYGFFFLSLLNYVHFYCDQLQILQKKSRSIQASVRVFWLAAFSQVFFDLKHFQDFLLTVKNRKTCEKSATKTEKLVKTLRFSNRKLVKTLWIKKRKNSWKCCKTKKMHFYIITLVFFSAKVEILSKIRKTKARHWNLVSNFSVLRAPATFDRKRVDRKDSQSRNIFVILTFNRNN